MGPRNKIKTFYFYYQSFSHGSLVIYQLRLRDITDIYATAPAPALPCISATSPDSTEVMRILLTPTTIKPRIPRIFYTT